MDREKYTANNQKEILEILKYANRVRSAIDRAKDKGLFANHYIMNSFPRGCCGETSDILGEYLKSKGVENLWYVCGIYRKGHVNEVDDEMVSQSHAWITVGNPLTNNHVIVDITGDQFSTEKLVGYYNKAVYVGFEDEFHKMFKVDPSDIKMFTGINTYPEHVKALLYNTLSILSIDE